MQEILTLRYLHIQYHIRRGSSYAHINIFYTKCTWAFNVLRRRHNAMPNATLRTRRRSMWSSTKIIMSNNNNNSSETQQILQKKKMGRCKKLVSSLLTHPTWFSLSLSLSLFSLIFAMCTYIFMHNMFFVSSLIYDYCCFSKMNEVYKLLRSRLVI